MTGKLVSALGHTFVGPVEYLGNLECVAVIQKMIKEEVRIWEPSMEQLR